MNEGYGVIIIGTLAFIYGLFCLFRILVFNKWQTAEGIIVTSSKSIYTENFQKFENADITYEYEVKKKKYRSSTVQASGDMSGSPSKKGASEIDRLLAKYPAGRSVAVYYNPSIPRMACLEQGGGEATFICLFFGPLAVAVGYFFLI